MAKKRVPKKCETCGHNSWDGRVCRGCKAYYGDTANAIAGSALARRLLGLTFDQVFDVLAELVDVIVPDWPGPNLQRLLFSTPVGPADLPHRQAAPTGPAVTEKGGQS